MPAQKRSERLQIMLTDDELAALDDFRFRYRMPSRAAAVRHILMQGLGVQNIVSANARERSADFGVVQARPLARRRSAV